MSNEDKFLVTFGGWYQRTTLHLSEVFGFLAYGFSKLDLSKEKLVELHHKLQLERVSREVGYLEYVKAKTRAGIEIRYYEDGLYTFTINSGDIKRAKETLRQYFEKFFNPAISYIFSLGAPTPKVLANIEATHQTVVSIYSQENVPFKVEKKKYGDVYSQLSSGGFTVYKTPDYIFVQSFKKSEPQSTRDLVEMQIFFREFKDQLEKYLNIHRKIWEEISDIKETKFVKGKDIEKIRSVLDSYQKTINLISSRINQMDTYVQTRASISKSLDLERKMIDLFQYKFEILKDTHKYIQEIWKMTSDYLEAAIGIISDVNARSLNMNVRSLQIITGIGVVSGIFGYLSASSLPKFTLSGAFYLLILLLIIWPLDFIIKMINRNLKYKLEFSEQTKNI